MEQLDFSWHVRTMTWKKCWSDRGSCHFIWTCA